ncbi:MAG: sugar transferase [Rhizobiales bacterium]|nr:sugar transferase [Hyphomicrobiales bacterium]
MAKRAFDIVASFLGLVCLSPLTLAVAIIVRTTSPGGAIFSQARVGRDEKIFKCHKFRTMAIGTPVAGTHEVSASWVTPIGRRLRALKLDELPQLWNVLKGEMSLVGPRPCLPTQSAVIEARRRLNVFRISPGVTGPAQIAGIDMSSPAELAEADAAYMKSASLPGDLRLIILTAAGKGGGDRIRA